MRARPPALPRLLAALLTAALLTPLASPAMPSAAPPAASGAYGASAPASAASGPLRQYTFAWQFADGSQLAPRGGSTRGVPVQLDTTPSETWTALQAPGLSVFERDRRAILAMAGGYRASFDFIEVQSFQPGARPDRPYQSWGTEKVYVLEDTGRRIVLQHLLVMSFVNPDGQVEGPFVTKHWRQDWQYEPTHRIVYRGPHTWQRIEVPRTERQGRWLQTVYQVDDSPRYSGLGSWQHLANYSSWGDDEGWRPLPRREFSVRHDYQVLIGSNRHTITPTGWVHEQANLKAVLDEKTGAVQSIIGRELGFNRYERITGIDWHVGDRYLQATEPVWSAVRAAWARLFAQRGTLRLKGAPDKDGLFLPVYQYADSVAEAGQPESKEKIAARVHTLVEAYLQPSAGPPAR